MAGRPQRRRPAPGKARTPHPVAPARPPLDAPPVTGPVGLVQKGEARHDTSGFVVRAAEKPSAVKARAWKKGVKR